MSDYLQELYPLALDAGISTETFWDSSYGELLDILESCAREEKRRRKEKILDDFILAEVTALNIAGLLSPDAVKQPKPWDYYDKLFFEEKQIYETADQKRKWEMYKEERRIYIAEINRRRQQGLM